MTLEQQILDAIGGGAFTRDLLHLKFPRVSQDAIDIKVYSLRKAHCIEENAVGRLVVIQPHVIPGQLQPAEDVDHEPPPTRQPARQPEESAVMPVEKKTCRKCTQTKPIKDFYAKAARCKLCVLADQKASKLKREAAAGKQPAARRSHNVLPPRRQSEGKAVTASRGNGLLQIPAGIEISGEAFRDRGQLQAIEIRSRDFANGDEADRTPQIVRMNRPQAERVYHWLGEELAKVK